MPCPSDEKPANNTTTCQVRRERLDLFASQAGESAGVLDLEVGSSASSVSGAGVVVARGAARGTLGAIAARSTSTTTLTTWSATERATTTTAGSVSTTASATASESTTSTALRALGGLDEALVDLDNGLLLALTLALGLSSGSADKVLLVLLGESFGVGPLLVDLGSLVGLAGLGNGAEQSSAGLLLLLEVVGVGLAVVLGLDFGGSNSVTVSRQGFLGLGAGNGITSLLISELSASLVGTPAMGSLLLGFAADMLARVLAELDLCLPSNGAAVSVHASTATATSTASTVSSSCGALTVGWLATVVGRSGIAVTESWV